MTEGPDGGPIITEPPSSGPHDCATTVDRIGLVVDCKSGYRVRRYRR